MGFGDAFVNSLVLIQRYFDMLWYYDLKNERLIVNPKFHQGRRSMLTWNVSIFLVMVAFTTCLTKTILLLSSAKTIDQRFMEQLIIYCVGAAVTVQALVTVYTLERRPAWFLHVIREIMELGNVHYTGFPSSRRLPDLQEIIGYGLFISFFLFPFSAMVMPLIRDWDPVNQALAFWGIFPRKERKIIAGLIYFAIAFHPAIYCASFLLEILAACYIFEEKLEVYLRLGHGETPTRIPHPLEKLAWVILRPVLKFLERKSPKLMAKLQKGSSSPEDATEAMIVIPRSAQGKWRRCKLGFHCLTMLMTPSNENVSVFIPVMTGVGITLCVQINAGLLKMYPIEEVRIMCFCGAALGVSIQWLLLYICHHAIKPSVFTQQIIQFWKSRAVGKMHRREVRALHPFGFNLGPFYLAKRNTAIEILDTIMDYTVTLSLA